MVGRHNSSVPLVLWLALSMILLVLVGCDEDGNNNLDGRYPFPDSGNVAIVTLSHRQLENNREALSYGWVEVLIDGARTTDADVTFGDQTLYFDSRDQAFTDQLTPALQPGTSYRIRVRSFTWGEDTTYINLPGDFDFFHSAFDTFGVGDDYDIEWTESSRAHRYILRIGIVDSTNALLVDTVGTDVRSYSWVIPEEARGKTLRAKISAHRTLNDAPVWSGTSETYSDFTFGINP